MRRSLPVGFCWIGVRQTDWNCGFGHFEKCLRARSLGKRKYFGDKRTVRDWMSSQGHEYELYRLHLYQVPSSDVANYGVTLLCRVDQLQELRSDMVRECCLDSLTTQR